jgi:hypothetical protein
MDKSFPYIKMCESAKEIQLIAGSVCSHNAAAITGTHRPFSRVLY